MPEDTILLNDEQFENITKPFLSEENELMRSRLTELVRKSKIKLLEDYLDWLAENNIIGKGSELHKERYIERFLDEREKRWPRGNCYKLL